MNDPQNDMLDAWKAKNPAFGPKPPPLAPVFRTDAERLEECRMALHQIMELSFTGVPKLVTLQDIWDLANIALARTQAPVRCDTVP